MRHDARLRDVAARGGTQAQPRHPELLVELGNSQLGGQRVVFQRREHCMWVWDTNRVVLVLLHYYTHGACLMRGVALYCAVAPPPAF